MDSPEPSSTATRIATSDSIPNGVYLLCHYGVTSGASLLNHFLYHYAKLGVSRILLILHCPDGIIPNDVRDVLTARAVEPADIVRDFSTPLKLARYETLVTRYCSTADWVLYADGDEFQVYPEPLPLYLCKLSEECRQYATGLLVDRLAPDGLLAPIAISPSIWTQFPFVAPATERITGGWTRKVCVARASVRLAEGGAHAIAFGPDMLRNYAITHQIRPGDQVIEVHHFKWDASLLTRLRNKLMGAEGDRERIDGAGFIQEYRRLQAHLERHSRIALKDADYVGTPTLYYP